MEIPSRYVTSKLQKGQHVELWYFTNAGLKHAKLNKATVDDDAMVAVAGKDGALDWILVAAVKNSKLVVADRTLTWEDFTMAVHRLQAHPYRSSLDPLDTKALLMYQDKQRRAWHQAIGSPTGAWDISTMSGSADHGGSVHWANTLHGDHRVHGRRAPVGREG
ncbi:hypothetical protein C0993_009017 [Termitomyces sp. T159_Od127]|nr:hypothetical protein C0993_009017 [Termitomyces sp. T159_Od127]